MKQSFRILLILVSILLTGVSPSLAQTVDFDSIASSYQKELPETWSIATQLTSNWSFSCSAADLNGSGGGLSESDLNTAFKLMVTYGLAQGLNGLAKINPGLNEIVVERLKKSISVYCDQIGEKAGEAVPFFRKLKINSGSMRVYLIAIRSVIRHDSSSAVVFHELLHLAYLDNVPGRIHNKPHYGANADVVYGCGSAPFGPDIDGCVVCALAEPKGKATALRTSKAEISEAENKCRSYYGSAEYFRPLRITSELLQEANSY